MSEKKTQVAAVKNINAERDEQIVKTLMEFVELAKEGHLSDVAIIGKLRGAPFTEFEWESDNPLDLLGALEMAKIEVASEILEASVPEEDEDGEGMN